MVQHQDLIGELPRQLRLQCGRVGHELSGRGQRQAIMVAARGIFEHLTVIAERQVHRLARQPEDAGLRQRVHDHAGHQHVQRQFVDPMHRARRRLAGISKIAGADRSHIQRRPASLEFGGVDHGRRAGTGCLAHRGTQEGAFANADDAGQSGQDALDHRRSRARHADDEDRPPPPLSAARAGCA